MTKREYKSYPRLIAAPVVAHGRKEDTREPIRRTDKVRSGEWR